MTTAVAIPPGFEQAIDSNPADDTPRLVLADWLEEQGEDLLALGWRATAGRVPRMTGGCSDPWSWWDEADLAGPKGADDLPTGLFVALAGAVGQGTAFGFVDFPTPFAAFEALAHALISESARA